VDRATFAALVETRSPMTIATLVSLLDGAAVARACLEGAAAAGIEGSLEPALSAFLGTHRAMALEALPAITRKNLGPEAAAWRQWLGTTHLPPQVAPAGWGA